MFRLLPISFLLLGVVACDHDSASHESKHELKFEVMEQKSDFTKGLEWQQDLPGYSRGYYPTADPASDLKSATQHALATNRNIMMVIGGDWCSWCHVMTRFFTENTAVRELLLSKFVLLKVNMSEDNDNQSFLSSYPEIKGYPHIFVLSSSGEFLASVNTAKLESGRSYSAAEFTEFISQY